MVAVLVANGKWGVATPLLLLGFASDLLDGYLARSWGATSKWGGRLDAQADRLLLVSPVAGMAASGDISAIAATLLIVGVWLADLVASKHEMMRLIWWPIFYALVAWGVWTHSSQTARLVFLTAAAFAMAAVLIVKRDEVRKIIGRKADTP